MVESSKIFWTSILLSFAFPIALILWMLTHVLKGFLGTSEVTPVRWLFGILLPIAFSTWGYRRKSLSLSGALLGFLFGIIITLSNFAYFTCLMVFFVTSSKATKFKSNEKKKFEDEFKEGGQRNWAQVMGSGIVASFIAAAHVVDCGFRELPVDFVFSYRCSWLATAFVGCMACCNGDTWASEFGSVLSKSSPRLITTMKIVPRGTNGGVTPIGTLMSALGGLIIGFSFWICLLLCTTHYLNAPPQWPIIVVGGLTGFLGSLVDSWLGAKFQYSGLDEKNRICDHPGENIKHICGRKILNNHSVNLISSLITALISPYLSWHVYNFFA